jgi:hypothetical protein
MGLMYTEYYFCGGVGGELLSVAYKGISLIFAGLDHRVGHCGVLHMTVESMGGSAHTK